MLLMGKLTISMAIYGISMEYNTHRIHGAGIFTYKTGSLMG